jgi:hypothetical protein
VVHAHETRNSEVRAQSLISAQPMGTMTMKYLIMFLISLGLLAALTIYAGAEPWTSRSYYSSSGSFAGSSITRGNSSSFYDGQGRFSGSAIRHGNSTSFYDGRGRYTGSVINTSPRR